MTTNLTILLGLFFLFTLSTSKGAGVNALDCQEYNLNKTECCTANCRYVDDKTKCFNITGASEKPDDCPAETTPETTTGESSGGFQAGTFLGGAALGLSIAAVGVGALSLYQAKKQSNYQTPQEYQAKNQSNYQTPQEYQAQKHSSYQTPQDPTRSYQN